MSYTLLGIVVVPLTKLHHRDEALVVEALMQVLVDNLIGLIVKSQQQSASEMKDSKKS
jgi:hypothetical protein